LQLEAAGPKHVWHTCSNPGGTATALTCGWGPGPATARKQVYMHASYQGRLNMSLCRWALWGMWRHPCWVSAIGAACAEGPSCCVHWQAAMSRVFVRVQAGVYDVLMGGATPAAAGCRVPWWGRESRGGASCACVCFLGPKPSVTATYILCTGLIAMLAAGIAAAIDTTLPLGVCDRGAAAASFLCLWNGFKQAGHMLNL
jgi:hypothetical protein